MKEEFDWRNQRVHRHIFSQVKEMDLSGVNPEVPSMAQLITQINLGDRLEINGECLPALMAESKMVLPTKLLCFRYLMSYPDRNPVVYDHPEEVDWLRNSGAWAEVVVEGTYSRVDTSDAHQTIIDASLTGYRLATIQESLWAYALWLLEVHEAKVKDRNCWPQRCYPPRFEDFERVVLRTSTVVDCSQRIELRPGQDPMYPVVLQLGENQYKHPATEVLPSRGMTGAFLVRK